MGYSPWGCKELDTTKVTEYTHTGTVKESGSFYNCFSEEVKKHTCTWNKRNAETNHKGNKALFFPAVGEGGGKLDLSQTGWNVHNY